MSLPNQTPEQDTRMDERRPGADRGRVRLLGLFVWSLVWLLVTNLAAEGLVLYCWQPFTNPRETARLTSAWTEFRNCQVLLIGSSLVEFGLAPSSIRREARRQLGSDICVLNLGQRGMSSESAASYLRAVLARTRPRIVLWGTSPQECMTRNYVNYFQTYASPSDALRALTEGPLSLEVGKRAIAACFRPPGLIFQGGFLGVSYLLRRVLSLAPTRFEEELEWTRRHAGWFPQEGGGFGSRMGFESSVQWRSIRELTRLTRDHDVRLAVLLMPIHGKVVRKEAPIRNRFSEVLGEYCRRSGIPYYDLLGPPHPVLTRQDFLHDGRHLVASGADKLSRDVSRRVVVPMLRDLAAEK